MNPYQPTAVEAVERQIDWLRRAAIGGRCVSLGCLAFSLALYVLFFLAWLPRFSNPYQVKLPDEFGFVPFATALMVAAYVLWRHSPAWRTRPRRALYWTVVAVAILVLGNVAGNYGWHRILM